MRAHRPHHRIDHWNFYLAYNLFRIAAILQGIVKRATDGTATSDAARNAPAPGDAGRKARRLRTGDVRAASGA